MLNANLFQKTQKFTRIYPYKHLKKILKYGIILINHYEKRMDMSNNIKKKMLIVLIAVITIPLLLLGLINILTKCTNESGETPAETTGYTSELKFSDEYITGEAELWLDEKYANADKTIYYLDPQTGVTIGIEDEKYDNYGAGTQLLCEMIASIMAGDADTYNTFFSEIYFSENEEKEEFSMQKLYDILITPCSATEETDENGNTYNEYIYALEYKIRRNNGSFRSDIDSDGNRTQYLLITDRGGSLLIDGIYTYGLVQ